MKIGIWGNYCYGNFGDDLMAISIANYLKRKGHLPVVYRLDKHLARKFDIETESSVSKLVSEVDFLLIGGGGMLVSNSRIKQIFSPVARKFEDDFKRLDKALVKFKKYIYPISIGGAGKEHVKLPKSREKFFSGQFVGEGTLRLKRDLLLTKKMGKSFNYYPDILFDVQSHFEVDSIRKPDDGEIWIGLNLISKDLKGERWIDELIKKAQTNPKLKLFFIQTHLENYLSDYEYVPTTTQTNVQAYKYRDIEDMLNLLTSLDIVISSKLHIGLTSLALGTPFVSFKGRDKTRAQLKELKADEAILDSGSQLHGFMDKYLTSGRSFSLDQIYDVEKLKRAASESKKHYRYIDQLISTDMKN